MSGPHLSDDRLIDLAAGLVAPEAEPGLLRHLESCRECEGRFRETCREGVLAQLRRRPPTVRGVGRWAVAAAAAVLLTATLLFLWDRTPVPDPASYWFPLGNETVELRAGGVDSDQAVFEEAAAAYRRRDPARVVGLLRGRAIPEAHDPLKIVLASALVKVGDPSAAREVLAELRLETLPQPDRDRARWILFAALTAAGMQERAREVAEDLAARPGEFSEAARRLLDQGIPASTNPAQ